MTRAAHIKYKIFSSGIWKISLFDGGTDYLAKQRGYIDDYKKLVLKKTKKEKKFYMSWHGWSIDAGMHFENDRV